MAITFPRSDILTTAGFTPPFKFDPIARQEISRLASGVTLAKDFGPALWAATYTTEEMRNDEAVDFMSMLDSLDGSIKLFEAWDLRRPAPRRHTDGSAADGVLASVNANNKALVLSGLNAGQIISRGDYLSFNYGANRALHRVAETVTANEGGLTPEFEVRPHLRPGWELAAVVNLRSPRGIFTLMPGSVVPTQTRGTFGVVSFQAVQYLE